MTMNHTNRGKVSGDTDTHYIHTNITGRPEKKHGKPSVAGRPAVSHLVFAFIPNCVNSQLSLQPRDTMQCGADYSKKQTKLSVTAQCNTQTHKIQQQPTITGSNNDDRQANTQPHVVVPITQTQKPVLTDPCNNIYNINSFQKQTKPHPEISYGQTDNPYNKQTVAFGFKEKTAVVQDTLAGIQSDNSLNIKNNNNSKMFSAPCQTSNKHRK